MPRPKAFRLPRPGSPLSLTLALTMGGASVFALSPIAHAQSGAAAKDGGVAPIGVIGGVVGKVFVLRGGDKLRAAKGMEIYTEDQLVTGKNSVAKIVFADGSSATSSEEGSVEIEEFRTLAKGNKVHLDSAFNVISGKVRFFVKPRDGGHSSKVRTANSVMGVRGTTFYVDAEPVSQRTRVIVEEGKVAVSNTASPSKEVVLVPGEASVVTAERPAERAPASEGATLVAGLKAAEKSVPEPMPEGVVPEGLDLPPPQSTAPARTVRVNAPAGGGKEAARGATPAPGTLDSGTAGARTVETGGVVVVPLERAAPPCSASNMATLRTLAQELDAGATEAASFLFPCEGYAHEAIFWIAFFHQAHGAPGAVEDAVRAAAPDDLALDVKSPRRFALEEALKGKREPVRRLNAQSAKPGKNAPKPDLELLLAEARTSTRLGAHADALRTYDAAVRVAATGLGGSEQVEVERAYVLLLARRFDTAALEFHRLEASRDERIKKQASRGLVLARRAGIPTSAARDDRFTLLGRHRRDFDDRRETTASLRWESRVVTLGLSSSALGAPTFRAAPGVPGAARLKTTATSFLAARDFTLSSGVRAGGEVGLFHVAKKDIVFFEGRGSYEAPFGGHLSGAFGRDALARGEHGEPLVDGATAAFATTRLSLALGWKEWVRYAFTRSTVEEFQASTRHALAGRLTLHRGETPWESVVAQAEVSALSWGEDVPLLFSPKSQTTYGGGVDGSYPLARWLAVEAGFGLHISTRKTWDADAKDAGTRSERLETVESDTATTFRGGVVFPVSPVWEAALRFSQGSASDAEGRTVAKDTRVLATVHWNYGRAGTAPTPQAVAPSDAP